MTFPAIDSVTKRPRLLQVDNLTGALLTSGGGAGGGGDASAARQDLQTAQLQSIAGLQVPAHNHVTLGYTGAELTSVVYRTGGAAGTVVATVTLAYTSGLLTSVTRT